MPSNVEAPSKIDPKICSDCGARITWQPSSEPNVWGGSCDCETRWFVSAAAFRPLLDKEAETLPEPFRHDADWRRTPRFGLSADRSTLEQYLRRPHVYGADRGLPGPVDEWIFRFPCGLKVLVEFEPVTNAYAQVFADADEVKHIYRHLHLDESVLPPQRYSQEEQDLQWTVWRMDDNGNEFFVSAHDTERSSQCVADEFEARGHKQTYFVRPASKRQS